MDPQNWNRFDEIHKRFEQMGGADGLIEAVKLEGLAKPIEPGQTAEEVTRTMETMQEETNKLCERKNALNAINGNPVKAFILIAGIMQHEINKQREKDSLIG